MTTPESELIGVDELRVGMYVELELGWLAHPFPTGSFRISSPRQIETIRGLGLRQIRYVRAKSELESESLPNEAVLDEAQEALALQRAQEARRHRAALIEAQERGLRSCEERFAAAQQAYQGAQEQVLDHPMTARDQCLGLVGDWVDRMNCEDEMAIRLLSEGAGERQAMHPVNVTVMCLLLGRALGLTRQEQTDLGVAAFLHDVGKLQLPQRVRWFEDGFSLEDFKQYQDHVTKSVAIANRMQLSEGALMAIAQHHEMMDGSGFPMQPEGSVLTMPARILALVNRYDNLCNPVRVANALTPHEALSLLFAQHKPRFDNMVLSAFIRMMGVYPPGSVVQLIDGRYALVVSVNAVRPLKPRVLVHEPSVPRHEALILDLETEPGLAIRRSLKPTALPGDALDYLSPRPRIAYFFETPGATAPAAGAARRPPG